MLGRRPFTSFLGRGWARLAYGRGVEPFWLETNKLELSIPDLDPRLDGISILQLSDFHLCRRIPPSHIRRAIDLGRQQKCDLVALTGDFVHAGFKYVDAIAAMLGRMTAPLGVFAVLGNHDHSIRIRGRQKHSSLAEGISSALRQQKIVVLDNEHHVVEYHGTPIVVAGVDDLWSQRADLPKALSGAPPECPRIVLAHNPATIDQARNLRVDLMLSGHTHGGQVHLNRFGRPMLRLGGGDHRLGAGLYYHDTGYLYVNKGIGYSFRFRYNVRPEIAVFRLRRLQQAEELGGARPPASSSR